MSGSLLVMAFGVSGGGPFGVTASPPSLSSGGRVDSRSTDNVTAVVSGGSGSFTFAWTILVTDHTISASAPTSATTHFDISGIEEGDEVHAQARCTVTDTVGGATVHVDVEIQHFDFRGFDTR